MIPLKIISLQELIAEFIEEGDSGFIDPLLPFEPIPISCLLSEAERRFSIKFSTSREFLDFVLAPESAVVDLHEKAFFKSALRVKEIEKKRKGKIDGSE